MRASKAITKRLKDRIYDMHNTKLKEFEHWFRELAGEANILITTEEWLKFQKQLNDVLSNNLQTIYQRLDENLKIFVIKHKRWEIVEYNNILFRLFIWRDMIEEYRQQNPLTQLIGFNFAHPQRSKSIEVLGQARSVWERDGWITPHNSFLHMIYRAGLLGAIFIVFIFSGVGFLTVKFIHLRSRTGIILTSMLVFWMVTANFLVILELPYNAIPFWSLFGMTFAYFHSLKASHEHPDHP